MTIVGKVENVYPIEMRIWDEGLVGHTNNVSWHVDLAIESPKEWRGLRPHFMFPAGANQDYSHLIGRVVSIRLKPDQARALFIDISPTQIHEGRDSAAPTAIVAPIEPDQLFKK